MSRKIQTGDALLIVDMQNDFLPGGSLAAPEADQVIPVINDWIAAAQEAGVPIIASRDWHTADHCSFVPQGGPWPPHCVKHTHGAMLHEDLNLPEDMILISKTATDFHPYSAFQGHTEDGHTLVEKLAELKVKRLWIVGLVLDLCVYKSGLDADKYGFAYHIVLPATRAIDKDAGESAIADMLAHNGVIEQDAAP